MADNAELSITVAALSDVGSVRANNEDSFGYDPARNIYVICDGMGGMAAGEVASQMAVSTFLETVAAAPPDAAIEITLHQAITAANDAVHHAGQDPKHRGMGTTLVAAAIQGTKLIIGNVGDSRAFMLQNGQCLQLTVDHSYLNELIRSGTIAVEDAPTIDLKGMESVITRAVGVAATIDPDFFSVDLTPGDVILLATDGLTRYIEAGEIGQIVNCMEIGLSAQSLIALAKDRGGADNITVLLLQVTAPA